MQASDNCHRVDMVYCIAAKSTGSSILKPFGRVLNIIEVFCLHVKKIEAPFCILSLEPFLCKDRGQSKAYFNHQWNEKLI